MKSANLFLLEYFLLLPFPLKWLGPYLRYSEDLLLYVIEIFSVLNTYYFFADKKGEPYELALRQH